MGADPETSAVNNYLQMWDVDNLFVVGASAFAHNGGYNPTGTVGALAYRAAEGILKYLDEGGQLVQAKKTSQLGYGHGDGSLVPNDIGTVTPSPRPSRTF